MKRLKVSDRTEPVHQPELLAVTLNFDLHLANGHADPEMVGMSVVFGEMMTCYDLEDDEEMPCAN